VTRRGDPAGKGNAQRDWFTSVPVKLPTSNSDLSGEMFSGVTLRKGVAMGTVSPPEVDTWAIMNRPSIFSWIYRRGPSIRTVGATCPIKLFCCPSWVSWVYPVIRGGGKVGRRR